MLPLGQFVEDPQEVDAGEEIPPAEGLVVTALLKQVPHRISQTSPSNSHVDASGFYQCHTIIMVANELMLIFYQYQTAKSAKQ